MKDHGWLDADVYNRKITVATGYDLKRINADEEAADVLADGAYDAGFEAGVEAQKHGLGEAA